MKELLFSVTKKDFEIDWMRWSVSQQTSELLPDKA